MSRLWPTRALGQARRDGPSGCWSARCCARLSSPVVAERVGAVAAEAVAVLAAVARDRAVRGAGHPEVRRVGGPLADLELVVVAGDAEVDRVDERRLDRFELRGRGVVAAGVHVVRVE